MMHRSQQVGALVMLGVVVALALLVAVPRLHAPPPQLVRHILSWRLGPTIPNAVRAAVYQVVVPSVRIQSASQKANGTWTVCVKWFFPELGPARSSVQRFTADGRPLGHNTMCLVVPPGATRPSYGYDTGPVGPPQP